MNVAAHFPRADSLGTLHPNGRLTLWVTVDDGRAHLALTDSAENLRAFADDIITLLDRHEHAEDAELRDRMLQAADETGEQAAGF